ncbi:hypothetical protein M5362_00075 [Streptomyces sp. Je 1-79]|uniref:hypothetical protein n=1 Tax=Streptomyces sp. Je 1-79 TaxID=2943847 RepID=UPI0021A824D7|nr:hypothetical protein [Streptomyces sp. Je 1-79]MCT4351528.1 hypothetical protein [Streptomyces sp. Je 1-79]
MTLNEGGRVRLAAEVRLSGSPVWAEDSAAGGDAVAGSLSLAAGTEGTVERVDSRPKEESHEVREYIRLTSLLDDFGAQMPPGSRGQLEDRIASLVPTWQAHERQRDRVTVRVRLDNGFVLDGVPEDLFTTA